MAISSYMQYVKTMSIVVLMFLFHFLCFGDSFSYNIPEFTLETDIFYEGDAITENGAIRLVPTASYMQYRVGRASYARPVLLYHSSTGRTANFITHFSFIIDILDFAKLSDGFAFFLSPVDFPIPPNSAGGGLGLFNSSTFHNRIVVVEFDTHSNGWDPPVTHIGINNGSLSSAAFASWDLRSTSRKEAHVWISYNATTKNLSVFCSYEKDPAYIVGDSNVSYIIDLKKVLPEWVRIGFSAATGPSFMKNTAIISWRFDSDLDSVKEFKSRKGKNRNKKTAVVLTGAVGLFLFIAIGYFVIRRKRINNASRNGHGIGSYTLVNKDLEICELPKRFSYQELEIATSSFADHMRLGRGGSGHVYKGILTELCRVVAVKRISTESVNSEKIFINEGKIISRLIHRNLVQFIGWCHEHGKFLLVYEYMPNGSLDTHLFGNRRPLPWQVRYRIAIGLASALHYLHEEAELCVLHRDVKPENILLDMDFSIKLGDFGIAKLVDPLFRTQTTGVVGTCGYLAPEYAYEGRATKESDMYSFGIVALEIACGRRTYRDEEYHTPLAKWVWELYLEGKIINAADEELGTNFNREEMQCLLMVGLWCSHPKSDQRLTSEQVIKALRFEASLPHLPLDAHDSTNTADLSQNLQKINSLAAPPTFTTTNAAGR